MVTKRLEDMAVTTGLVFWSQTGSPLFACRQDPGGVTGTNIDPNMECGMHGENNKKDHVNICDCQ